MKTVPVVFLAALAAFVLFPLSFEIAGSVLFAGAFAAIAFADYTRAPRPLRIAVLPPVAVSAGPRERFGLAA